MLFRSFQCATHDGMQAELWIIGDGSERGEIESIIAKHGLEQEITLHGWVPQDKCPALIAQCDVLVLPSIRECGGAVVLEAMALGLPVVATDWGGPADYINEETGILIPPSSPAELTTGLDNALTSLSGNSELRKKMGLAGRGRIEIEFDW